MSCARLHEFFLPLTRAFVLLVVTFEHSALLIESDLQMKVLMENGLSTGH